MRVDGVAVVLCTLLLGHCLGGHRPTAMWTAPRIVSMDAHLAGTVIAPSERAQTLFGISLLKSILPRLSDAFPYRPADRRDR